MSKNSGIESLQYIKTKSVTIVCDVIKTFQTRMWDINKVLCLINKPEIQGQIDLHCFWKETSF